jgi:hypothetical protein
MIFDTDVLIWHFRGDASAAPLIESQPIHAISIVSLMELIQAGSGERAPLSGGERYATEAIPSIEAAGLEIEAT